MTTEHGDETSRQNANSLHITRDDLITALWGMDFADPNAVTLANKIFKRLSRPKRVYDIPVLFQARAENEQEAAEYVGSVLRDFRIGGGYDVEANEVEIESWHMPNHQYADGSDNPVRVVIVPLEPEFSQRRGLVNEIERLVVERCANCGEHMNTIVRGHHHSEDGKDVTR